MSAHRMQSGIAGVESLVALPILLFLGLGALQFGLVFQARHALNHALVEAARAGSVAHADPQAIRTGLARGLLPWLYGAADIGEYAVNLGRAAVHVTQGQALGWLRLERVSPTVASFDDWADKIEANFEKHFRVFADNPDEKRKDLVHKTDIYKDTHGSG